MEISKQNVSWIIAAILGGIVAGLVLYGSGTSIAKALFLITLLTLFLISLRSPKIALFLFFLTIPIHYTAGIDIGKSTIRLQHIFGIAFILAILYYLFIHEKREAIMKRMATPIDIPLFFLFIIMTISIIQTIYVPNNPPINLNRIYNYPWIKGIVKLLLLTVNIGVFYGIQAMLQTKEDIKKWLTRYITIGGIVALYGLIAFLIYIATSHYISLDGYKAIVDIPGDLPRIKATEQEPSFFAFYLITIIPLIFALIMRQRKEKIVFYNNTFLFSIGAIILLALFLSGSRSGILAFLFSGITLFFFYKEQPLFQYLKKRSRIFWLKLKVSWLRKALIVIFLCLAISVPFTIIIYWDEVKYTAWRVTTHNLAVPLPRFIEEGILAPTIGTFNANYGKFWSTRTRLIMYGYALDAFRQHPWVGIGYENYNFYTGTKTYLGLLDINITWPEVNNYPLKILAEQGVIGFFAFLFFVVVLFYHFFRARNKTHDPFLKAVVEGYIAVFVGIAIMLLFSSNIMKQYIWVALAFGIAIVKIINNSKDG